MEVSILKVGLFRIIPKLQCGNLGSTRQNDKPTTVKKKACKAILL
jgi:hypothetical protein